MMTMLGCGWSQSGRSPTKRRLSQAGNVSVLTLLTLIAIASLPFLMFNMGGHVRRVEQTVVAADLAAVSSGNVLAGSLNRIARNNQQLAVLGAEEVICWALPPTLQRISQLYSTISGMLALVPFGVGAVLSTAFRAASTVLARASEVFRYTCQVQQAVIDGWLRVIAGHNWVIAKSAGPAAMGAGRKVAEANGMTAVVSYSHGQAGLGMPYRLELNHDTHVGNLCSLLRRGSPTGAPPDSGRVFRTRYGWSPNYGVVQHLLDESGLQKFIEILEFRFITGSSPAQAVLKMLGALQSHLGGILSSATSKLAQVTKWLSGDALIDLALDGLGLDELKKKKEELGLSVDQAGRGLAIVGEVMGLINELKNGIFATNLEKEMVRVCGDKSRPGPALFAEGNGLNYEPDVAAVQRHLTQLVLVGRPHRVDLPWNIQWRERAMFEVPSKTMTLAYAQVMLVNDASIDGTTDSWRARLVRPTLLEPALQRAGIQGIVGGAVLGQTASESDGMLGNALSPIPGVPPSQVAAFGEMSVRGLIARAWVHSVLQPLAPGE